MANPRRAQPTPGPPPRKRRPGQRRPPGAERPPPRSASRSASPASPPSSSASPSAPAEIYEPPHPKGHEVWPTEDNSPTPGAITQRKQFLYQVENRDLQRFEALKRAIATTPDIDFAEAVWQAVADGMGVNERDPLLSPENKWKGKRPARKKLLQFGISLLNRCAPDMLAVVRMQVGAMASQFTLEALGSVVGVMRNPATSNWSGGQGNQLKAAMAILQIAGVTSEGAGAKILIQNNASIEGTTKAFTEATNEELQMLERARQQLYDAMNPQFDHAPEDADTSLVYDED